MKIPTKSELDNAGIRILVAIPLERQMPAQSFLHFWEIARRGWPIVQRGYGRIDENRNEAGHILLQSDYTHLCMLDIDQWHQPDIVEQLAKWVLDDPTRLIISGLHFRRSEPYDPLLYGFLQGKLVTPLHWGKGLVKADAAGHGSILISRKVLEQLARPWWAYAYRPDMVGKGYESEDIYFFRRCYEANIALWVDTTITSPHITEAPITEETFRLWLAAHPQALQQTGENQYAIEMDRDRVPARHTGQGSERRRGKAVRREKVPALNGVV